MSLTPFVHLDASLAGRRAGEALTLDEQDRHHLRSVLRLPVGAAVEVSDGVGGHAPAILAEGGEVVLSEDAASEPAPQPRLRVLQALPKGRKMDDVVRAAVELGVDELVPVAASRSVARLEGARAAKAVDRWRAVARAASEQSRRHHRAAVADIADPAALQPDSGWLVAHPSAATALREALVDLADAAELTVAIGPEGGFSPAEVEELVAAGARAVHLGPGVLRTEHAAPAALAAISAVSGRWDRRAR